MPIFSSLQTKADPFLISSWDQWLVPDHASRALETRLFPHCSALQTKPSLPSREPLVTTSRSTGTHKCSSLNQREGLLLQQLRNSRPAAPFTCCHPSKDQPWDAVVGAGRPLAAAPAQGNCLRPSLGWHGQGARLRPPLSIPDGCQRSPRTHLSSSALTHSDNRCRRTCHWASPEPQGRDTRASVPAPPSQGQTRSFVPP